MAQKKSKQRPEEPLGTMSYQTSSKRSPPLCFLIGARKLLCFSAPWVSEDASRDNCKMKSLEEDS